MAFEQYGGYVWSEEPAPPVNPIQEQLLKIGLAGTAAGLGLAYATTRGSAEWNPLDTIYQTATAVGNLSPYGIANTFRVPEFLSPWLSPAGQQLSDEGAAFVQEWSAEYLTKPATRRYLQEAFGLTDEQLIEAGLVGDIDTIEAEKLIFERAADSPRGSLYTLVEGERKYLTRSAQLMRLTSSLSPASEEATRVNRAAFGLMQALNLWQHKGFSPKQVFKPTLPKGAEEKAVQAAWFPVPSVTGEGKEAFDIWRRSALLRAVPAFEIERFNRLISGFVYQTFGKKGQQFFTKLTGLGVETVPGPATHVLARLGVRAAAAGAAIGGIAQLDWFRRQEGLAGHMAASAVVAGGVGFAVSKLSTAPKAPLIGAVSAFAAQMMLPGFEQGIVPGLATTAANLSIVRANPLNPFNYQRRIAEGFFPGISSWQLGALLGIGAVVTSYSKIPELLLKRHGPETFKLPNNISIPKSLRETFWEQVKQDKVLGKNISPLLKKGQSGMLGNFLIGLQVFMGESPKSFTERVKRFNDIFAKSKELYDAAQKDNPLNKALLQELQSIRQQHNFNTTYDNLIAEFKASATQLKYSFFGATPAQEEVATEIRKLGFGFINLPDIRTKLINLGLSSEIAQYIPSPKRLPISLAGRGSRAALLFGTTFLAQQLLTGGLLGSMETAEELKQIYSGEKLVEVKKSRWWEGGGTPFSGSETSYYRPHMFALLMNRVREKGIWGEKEDEISPLEKFLLKNFTYELEKATYWDRPYPITSTAFEDIPILGPVLASTIGRLIKPPKLMHVGEWIRETPEGNLAYADVYEGWRQEPAYSLGGLPSGIPVSPYSAAQQLSYMSYQFRELEGITGWAKSMFMQTLTGEDQFATDSAVLASASLMTSARIRFWETQQGGLFFMNEAIRRLFPRYRSEIERQNPIMNRMPTWMPEKFKYGDPYRSVEWGEARLPGPGYAALHPELKGVDPENYPLAHRYSILADVAPFSKELAIARMQVYQLRSQGYFSPKEEEHLDEVDRRLTEKYNIYSFDRVHENAIALPGSSFTQNVTYSARNLIRRVAAPIEYLLPFGLRPVQKLLGDDRSPIERYEYERLYGTPFAFWDKPIRDFLRPAVYSTARMLGWEGKPLWRIEADKTQEYFDKLEFVKWMQLAEEARASGNKQLLQKYLYLASNTRTGVNPQGNPLSIYWTLPRSERAFFNAFAFAKGSERERILEMIPADQQHLYKAIWSRMDSSDPSLWPGAAIKIDEEYLNRQLALTQQYFAENPLPPDDWIGWHEDASLTDIKVKYIDRLGRDLHDYDLWEGQLKKTYREPYLEDALKPLPLLGVGRAQAVSQSRELLPAQTTIHTNSSLLSSAKIIYNDDRKFEIMNGLEGYIGGY